MFKSFSAFPPGGEVVGREKEKREDGDNGGGERQGGRKGDWG